MQTSVIGFPRIGTLRELKFASEKYFKKEIEAGELLQKAQELRKTHWLTQKNAGITYISSNDFSFYDMVLDTAALLGIVPKRYKELNLSELDTYFAMARGYQGTFGDVKALAMKKWFNTNYHYIVPELEDDTEIKISGDKLWSEYAEAKSLGIETKPVVTGAYTILKLCRCTGNKTAADYVDEIERIYDSYLAGGGRELVCMAYLSYFSHYYLVNDMMIPEHVFSQIRERYLAGQTLNDACLLGLLKQLSEISALDAVDNKIADELLMKYTGRNLYFAFYKKFGETMIRKYHLYDKFFVEYHTKADQHVLLNYSVNGGEYHKEEITEVYDGIYVKAFVLLFGESVSYYISEKLHGEWKVVESRQISNQNMYGDKDQSRYDVINNIMFAYAMQDETMLSESMRKYVSMDDTVKKLFKLL